MTTTETTGNRFSDTYSANRKGEWTSDHVRALNILGLNSVVAKGEQVVRCWGIFDFKGRPVSYKVDILVDDTNFGSGVVHIDGSIHDKLTVEKKDGREDERLRKLGLWVERVRNEDVGSVMVVLEKHRVAVDEYGGRS
jgi:hypothetical protein